MSVIRDPARLFARPRTNLAHRPDGSIVLGCPQPLGPHARSMSEYLEHWAEHLPQRQFLLERAKADGPWHGVTYKEALDEVLRVAGWLVAQRISAERPVAILSKNGIEHALLTLAAMHVGIPAMPISTAYSLASTDFGKLKSIIQRTSPSLIFVDDNAPHARALSAIRPLHDATVVVGSASATVPEDSMRFDSLRSSESAAEVARACSNVTPDTVAKVLFTSGSTDDPKGAIITQGMLCSNQQARLQLWPFLATQPPVVVDWLPWSHAFGGNHNFNMVLRNGGTLYIDGGRPMPALFSHTLTNLREIAPTIYFNVPAGYELLVHALQTDAALREHFFSRLQLIFYAAAALPPHLWDALNELAVRTTGETVPLVSGWGSTETGPLATDCNFQAEGPGVIGVPVPGCELKLVGSGDKLEVRVRGPNVTPGYWGRADLTARHFDAEGFYCIGDAVRFVDATAPERGLLFDGRVSEDFKLRTGTWVSVGALRLRAIAALAPIAQDVVIAGHDQNEVSVLIFPNIARCRALCDELDSSATIEHVLAHPALRARVLDGLRELHRQAPGSSTHAARALLLAEPPSSDGNEITDKGYLNQRAVLRRRAALVAALQATPADPEVIALRAPD